VKIGKFNANIVLKARYKYFEKGTGNVIECLYLLYGICVWIYCPGYVFGFTMNNSGLSESLSRVQVDIALMYV